MRSSTISASVTAGLILVVSAFKLPALLVDQRSSHTIWTAEVEPGFNNSLRFRLTDACRSKLADQHCAPHVNADLARIKSAARYDFDRCVAGAWAKSRCVVAARNAMAAADATPMLVGIEVEAAKQRAEADRQRAVVEAKQQCNQTINRRIRNVEG